MRDTIGGLLMLFGLLIVGMGIWEAVFEDTGEAWATMLTGGVFVAAGFWVVNREPAPFAEGAPAEAGTAGDEAVATVAAAPIAEAVPSDPLKKRFTIIQTGDDGVLDRVAALLADDARITSVVEESGRWYSVPDRDNLPEWLALRVYCITDDLDAFMAEIDRLIVDRLGREAASEVRVSHY